jgi:hypothetical protein
MPLEYQLSVGLDERGRRWRRWNVAVQTVHQLSRKHGYHRRSGENAPSKQHRIASILGKRQPCFRPSFTNNSQAAVGPIDILKT